jgi:hypothetical protein
MPLFGGREITLEGIVGDRFETETLTSPLVTRGSMATVGRVEGILGERVIPSLEEGEEIVVRCEGEREVEVADDFRYEETRGRWTTERVGTISLL